MSHPDDEALAELVLGGGRASDAEHAAACAECRAEIESLQAMLARAQQVEPGGALLTPPDRVWDAIVADISAAPEGQAEKQPPGPVGGESTEARGDAPVDELASRRARRTPWSLVAAAAAGIVVGGVGVGVVVGPDRDPDGVQVVAQTELTDLTTEVRAGQAVLETRPDGTQVLVVSTDERDVEDAYLEVWLIDEAIDGMVSLGHLTDGSGEFVIPAGFDVGQFPIVDISVEPLDGVPTHSGDSVTRGVLDA